jgi:Flp pilus assembly protein TadG
MRRRCRGDDGTAGVEAAIAVVALLAVMFFVVGAMRVTNSGADVDAAARSAARAAAAERTMGAAQASAAAVAGAMLADRGVACEGLSVGVGGSLTAGGVVTVTVTCSVNLSDASLGGFGGSRQVVGHGVEAVDSVRGGG